jgi:quercetin dioxygenase-like cupin family protein
MIVRAGEGVVEPTRHGPMKRVILRGGVLPDVTQVAVATFAGGDEVETHAHPTMYELYYVLEGRAEYRIGGESHDAGPGDFLIAPPGTPHGLRVVEAPHRVFYWGIAREGAGLP